MPVSTELTVLGQVGTTIGLGLLFDTLVVPAHWPKPARTELQVGVNP